MGLCLDPSIRVNICMLITWTVNDLLAYRLAILGYARFSASRKFSVSPHIRIMDVFAIVQTRCGVKARLIMLALHGGFGRPLDSPIGPTQKTRSNGTSSSHELMLCSIRLKLVGEEILHRLLMTNDEFTVQRTAYCRPLVFI